MDFQISRFEEIPSTNEFIKEKIHAGAPEGTVAVASSQSGGYGRRGNSWSSPKGGLYLSILLRPNVDAEDLATLSHISAIAVRRAVVGFLDESTAEEVKIKWPNDVVLMPELQNVNERCSNGRAQESEEGNQCGSIHEDARPRALFRKICGISVEALDGGVCVGIGINVARPNFQNADDEELADKAKNAASSRGKNILTYLDDLTNGSLPIKLRDLEARLLSNFNEVYHQWVHTRLSDLRDEYMDHFALEGFKARIGEDDQRAIECEVIGIDEKGCLEVIPFGETEITKLRSGTVRNIR